MSSILFDATSLGYYICLLALTHIGIVGDFASTLTPDRGMPEGMMDRVVECIARKM